jgi:hypothetical protein
MIDMEERNINEVYEKMLGLIGDWKVTTVEMDDGHKEMHAGIVLYNALKKCGTAKQRKKPAHILNA